LRARLRELAEPRRRFGYRHPHVLLGHEGIAVNLKRVRRLYREEGLSLRQRRGRRRYHGIRVAPAPPVRNSQRWSMDGISDALADGRRSRVSSAVDDFSRECLASEAGCSLTGIEDAYVESFNGRCRDECLNKQLFVTIDEARSRLEAWRLGYNHARPHSSLGNLTPEEYVQQHRVSHPAEPKSVRSSLAWISGLRSR
jgi:putative transposase